MYGRGNTGAGRYPSPWWLRLQGLPDDVLFMILSWCDIQSLGRLACTCRRLAHLVRQDCVWVSLLQRVTVVGDCRQQNPDNRWEAWNENQLYTKRDQCRIAINWGSGNFRDVRLIHHGVKQLPWLQFDKEFLWVSYGNLIKCYWQRMDGSLVQLKKKTLRGHQNDITRFVQKGDVLVSGSREGRVCCFNANVNQTEQQLLWRRAQCHSSDVHAVDFHDDIIVSGSRDSTVKLWSMDAPVEDPPLHILHTMDRVWSVAMNPDGSSFAVGTAGISNVPPLRLWDTETMELLGILGNQYRHGAGVLDIQYESPDVIYSCGYDTFVRMWDLRTSWENCVLKWEEPFDMTVYSVKSDGNNAVMAGTARHGMARLWDKRSTKPVMMYYAGRSSSPVYSLAFDSRHLYVALDRGINILNFNC